MSDTYDGTPILQTRIPEGRRVAGLERGAHVATQYGWSGRYVRIGQGCWHLARLTPAEDELPGDGSDGAILAAILAETEEVQP